jgi:hypothetical protein
MVPPWGKWQVKTTLRSLLNFSTIAIVAFVMLQAGGCTVVGLVGGVLQDVGKPGFGPIDSTRWSSLKKGTEIKVKLKSDMTVSGNFEVITTHFRYPYSGTYSRARVFDSTLPPLGSLFAIEGRSRNMTTGRLAGFEVRPGAIENATVEPGTAQNVLVYLSADYSTRLQMTDLDTVAKISLENGESVGVQSLKESVLSASLPSPSTLVLKENEWRTTYIQLAEIEEVRYPHERQAFKGMVGGLAADLIMYGLVYYAFQEWHWGF